MTEEDRFFIDDIADQVVKEVGERPRIDQEDVIRELCFELERILDDAVDEALAQADEKGAPCPPTAP